MSEIKAIETRYKGYRFRSRLEARWAVFFDSLQLSWQYEKEGFHLPSGSYLPDFWIVYPHIPEAGYWVEIKPNEPDEYEQNKMAELVETTGHRGYILCGNIGEEFVWVYQHHRNGTPSSIPLVRNGNLYQRHTWWNGRIESTEIRIDDSSCVNYPFPGDGSRKTNCLEIAREAARSARFEHGENPAKGDYPKAWDEPW